MGARVGLGHQFGIDEPRVGDPHPFQLFPEGQVTEALEQSDGPVPVRQESESPGQVRSIGSHVGGHGQSLIEPLEPEGRQASSQGEFEISSLLFMAKPTQQLLKIVATRPKPPDGKPRPEDLPVAGKQLIGEVSRRERQEPTVDLPERAIPQEVAADTCGLALANARVLGQFAHGPLRGLWTCQAREEQLQRRCGPRYRSFDAGSFPVA